MKIRLVILSASLLAKLVFAECDCSIVPFKPNPPCFEECTAKILGRADYVQLTTLFGLPPTVSRKIVNLPDRKEATSLEPFKKVLSSGEISTVETKFRTLAKKDLERFYNSRESKVREHDRP